MPLDEFLQWRALCPPPIDGMGFALVAQGQAAEQHELPGCFEELNDRLGPNGPEFLRTGMQVFFPGQQHERLDKRIGRIKQMLFDSSLYRGWYWAV